MKKYIERSMTFAEYTKLIDDLLAEGKTTGENQSDAMTGYALLNRQRMKRLDKTVELGDGVKTAAHDLTRKMTWLIITEGWCGDAAQNVPAIEKIAAESDKIETRYILRDENLDLMDQYLSAGARSIPKLIAVDPETDAVLGTWGPRPDRAKSAFEEMRSKGMEKSVILEEMQRWYNADKSNSIQSEFEELIKEWGNGHTAAARG